MKRTKLLGTIITVLLVGAIGTACGTSAEGSTTEAMVVTEAATEAASEEKTEAKAEAASEEKSEEKTETSSKEKDGEKVIKVENDENGLTVNYVYLKNVTDPESTDIYFEGKQTDVAEGGKAYVVMLEPGEDVDHMFEYKFEVGDDVKVKTINISGQDDTEVTLTESTEEQ
ncbi:MAG: hypothetical protein J6O17_07380 [Eubacterium sp.]|nr:hypothetical protein [Eubacterium sp.]